MSRYPSLNWDLGTAYDLFISLHVLHEPEKFGLRPSWAAGVRSRLSLTERRTLEQASVIFGVPLHWIFSLPSPKDGASALWALQDLPASERLFSLALYPKMDADLVEILYEIGARKEWKDRDLEALKEAYRQEFHETPRPKTLTTILDAFTQVGAFGERYLEALQAYYQAFFAEEEQHLKPELQEGLRWAQELADREALPDLFEQLSQGVQMADLLERPELVFVPSYWSTPFVFIRNVEKDKTLVVFGARPAEASLVPGEVVPDSLLRVLKAIADPTRLSILRYLAHEPLTPAELSRRLRLRAPTVTHHLGALRLAGLVHLKLCVKDERHYTARLEAIQALHGQLKEFLLSAQEEQEGK